MRSPNGCDTEEPAAQIAIPIEWYIPDDLTTDAVTNMVVNHTPQGEFFITFFEITPPFIFGDGDSLQRIKSVRATAVARIMVVGERLPAIIKALQDNYERWKGETSDEGGKQ